jgi:high-affinity nickel-transport protein
VAFVIGGVELLQVLSGELGWRGPYWYWVDTLNFETLGIAIVVLFLLSWGVAMAIYYAKGYENVSWAATGPPSDAASEPTSSTP